MNARREFARTRGAGHTLIELLVALAVVGILGVLANASYTHFVVAARRFDARAALAAVAAAQERHYLRYASYASRLAAAPGGPAGPPPVDAPPGTLPLPDVSPDEHYAVRIVAVGGDDFRVEARPRGAQQRDRECAVFVLGRDGMRHAESSTGADTTRRCWSGA